MLCFYVKYRVLRFFSYLCTQNIIVMVDKRTLEFILTDQHSIGSTTSNTRIAGESFAFSQLKEKRHTITIKIFFMFF